MIFKELYKYRELLSTSVKKEIRGKYKGSLLGVMWSFVSPLLMILVYATIFPLIMRGGTENYYIYLTTGILPWIFFSNSIAQGAGTIIANAGLIKKVYFPRVILPISIVTSGAINFIISCVVIFIFLLASGMGITVNVLYLPLIIIVQYIFTLGLLFIISSINVYIRDVEYIVNFLILLLMYLTPILWQVDMIASSTSSLSKYADLVFMNPLAGIIESYHNIFYYQVRPSFTILGLVAIYSVIQLIVGYKIFRKLERGFAEEM